MPERPHPPVEPEGNASVVSTERLQESSETSVAALDEALAHARPEPPAGLPLAQARVAGALFGSVPSARFGRFRVLERLGAGAMGVVYAAYDPDLDRGVALKLVNVPGRSREIALAEAKALARLSHPNVVPVHDVGVEGDWVYIVLELVRGETLDRWAKGRDAREIIDIYRQAGEALAAAHGAGLVHRDFKPTNALVGHDGRVRVVDFGLACEATTTAGDRRAIAGTPRYMAPEQAAGDSVTPAADQYSFSVALAEALTAGERPMPRWVEGVLARARAREPAERFASMRELLRALARDPARRRRRWLASASLAGLAGITLIASRSLSGEDLCAAGERLLEETWRSEARAAAVTKIEALGSYGATLAPWFARELRDYSRRWSNDYRQACVSRHERLQSEALVDRRMACLDRGRSAFHSVAAVAESADARTVPDVARAVRALPDPDECADLQSLLAGVEPPPASLRERVGDIRKQIAEARVLVLAGQFERAHAMAQSAVAEARSISYRPLLAEALLVDGHATMTSDPPDDSLRALDEAATISFEIGSDALGVEAWARRAWLRGTTSGDPTVLSGLDVVEAVAARAPVGGFARALLYNNVGGVELARERPDRATAAFERALQESQGVTGPGAVELVNVRVNLGLVTRDPARRSTLFVEAEQEMTKLLGANHPDTLIVSWVRAMWEVDYARALELMTPTCEGFDLHQTLAAQAALCWSEVGYLRHEIGDEVAAARAMEKAIGADGRRADESPEALAYLFLWKGSAREAVDHFRAALAATKPPPPEEWWSRRDRAKLELGLGRAYLALGDVKNAEESLRSSVEVLAAIERDHPKPDVMRRLARARIELAKALARERGNHREVSELATSALAWLTEAGAAKDDIAEATRFSRRP